MLSLCLFKGKGFVSSRIRLVALEKPFQGNGMKAEEPMRSKTVFARIPLHKMINIEHAYSSDLNQKVRLLLSQKVH